MQGVASGVLDHGPRGEGVHGRSWRGNEHSVWRRPRRDRAPRAWHGLRSAAPNGDNQATRIFEHRGCGTDGGIPPECAVTFTTMSPHLSSPRGTELCVDLLGTIVSAPEVEELTPAAGTRGVAQIAAHIEVTQPAAGRVRQPHPRRAAPTSGAAPPSPWPPPGRCSLTVAVPLVPGGPVDEGSFTGPVRTNAPRRDEGELHEPLRDRGSFAGCRRVRRRHEVRRQDPRDRVPGRFLHCAAAPLHSFFAPTVTRYRDPEYRRRPRRRPDFGARRRALRHAPGAIQPRRHRPRSGGVGA